MSMFSSLHLNLRKQHKLLNCICLIKSSGITRISVPRKLHHLSSPIVRLTPLSFHTRVRPQYPAQSFLLHPLQPRVRFSQALHSTTSATPSISKRLQADKHTPNSWRNSGLYDAAEIDIQPVGSSATFELHSVAPVSRTRQHRAAIGTWSTVLAIGVGSGAYILYSWLTTTNDHLPQESAEDTNKVYYQAMHPVEASKGSAMTRETLPGRPGTLTPDEEVKLQEFWTKLLQIYGIKDLPKERPATATSSVADSTTKKTKRSFFGRRAKEEESLDADEDKYGQEKQFEAALASGSPEKLRDILWSMLKHDHPDALLLRFLRARKWDVQKALVMMVSTMHWRANEMHVDDDIIFNGELAALEASQDGTGAAKSLGQDFMAQMRMGKSFLHGCDLEDRPLCVVRARLHRAGEQSVESLERYTVFLIESARIMLSPPVDTACIIFDLTGFSLANMDYTPVKFMIKCFEANYPESLGVVLVHKAPWVFQGIWRIIRGWLDPVVASKVNFTNNEAEMEKYIPKHQIPKELGGDEDWEYEYIEPVPGENDLMKDTATRDQILAEREKLYSDFETETVSWLKSGSSGDAEAVKSRRNQLANELRANYWKLDPYVRARSLYDRTGMMQPGGTIRYYQGVVKDHSEEVHVPAMNGDTHVQTAIDNVD